MPTYQYACTACGHQLEAVQSFSDDPLTQCPACEGRLRKLFGSVGIVFKGPGFYRTDSRSAAAAAAGNGSGSGSGSGGRNGRNGAGDGTGNGSKPAETGTTKDSPASSSSASKPSSEAGGNKAGGNKAGAGAATTAS